MPNNWIVQFIARLGMALVLLVVSAPLFAQVAPSFTITPSSATLAEGESQVFTVRMLNGPPPHPAGLVLGSPTRPYATVRNNVGRFTAANWQQPQTFTVTANNDAIDNLDDRRRTTIPFLSIYFGADGFALPIAGPRPNIIAVDITVTDNDTAPDAPTGLGADTAGDGEIALSWTAPVNTGTINTVATAITGYEYRQQAAGVWSDWNTIPTSAPGQANAASYTVTGLTNGTAYTFEVRAVSAAGKGAASVSDSETPVALPATVPDAPTGLTAATAGDGEIALSWTAPVNTGTAAITGYEYRQQAAGLWSDWNTIPTSAPGQANAASYTVTGLTNGTAYTFEVRAVSAAGKGVASASASETPVAPPATAPDAPTGLTAATAGDGEVALSWMAADDGGDAIIRHEYQQKAASDAGFGAWLVIADSAPGGANDDSFTVTGLTNGTAYTFAVRAVNAIGNSAASNQASKTPVAPDVTPPTVTISTPRPSHNGDAFTATLSFSEDVMDFGGPSGLVIESGITIGNGTSSNFARVAADRYTVTVTPNSPYVPITIDLVAGVARDAASNANTAATQVIVHGHPSAPQNVRTQAGDTQVTLTWNEPAYTSTGIVSYHYRIDGGAAQRIGDGTSRSVTIPNLVNGQSYRFEVKADSLIGDTVFGQYSAAVSATPATVPSAPTNLTATAGNTTVKLDWDDPGAGDDGGSAITGYEVSRDNGNNWVITSSTDSSFNVTGLTNGTRYTFRVRAVNAIGNSAASASVLATPDGTAPTVTITNQPANHDGTTAFDVSINFSEPVQNFVQGDVTVGNATVTSFTAHSASGYSVEITPTAGRNATITIDVGVNVAQDLATNPNTAAVQVSVAYVAPATAPDAPVITGATPTTNSALLSIQEPADNGAPITQYEYQLKEGDGAFRNWQDIDVIAAVPGFPATVLIQNLAANTDYTIRLRAENSAGTGAAVESSFTTLSVLGTPSALTAVAGDGQVALSWTPSTNNGGQAITYYRYRQQAAGDPDFGAWQVIPTSAPGDAHEASYTVTGLVNGTAYTFEVQSSSGFGFVFSAASNQASATPVDTTDPTVAITTNTDAHDGTTPFTATFTFSEDVTGFAVGDINVGGGSASNFGETSARVYTATIRPTMGTTAAITIDVGVGGAQDTADNDNEAATQVSVPYFVRDANARILVLPGRLGTVAENGGTTDFTITLSRPPTEDILVVAQPLMNNSGITANVIGGNIINDRNWDTPKTIRITGVDDAIANPNPRPRALVRVSLSERDGGIGSRSSYHNLETALDIKVIDDDVAPDAPSNLTAIPGNTEVYLSWVAPTTGGAVTRYEYSTDGGTTWTTTGSTNTRYTVTSLANDNPVSFTVRAVNAIGNSAASNQDSATPTAGARPPDAPTNLAATPRQTREVNLTWDAPANNGGSAITDYEYSTDSGANWNSTGGTGTNFVVLNLIDYNLYTFIVRAVNAQGASVVSNPALVRPVPNGITVVGPRVLAVPEDGSTSASFTLRLNTQPGGDVTISIAPPSIDGTAIATLSGSGTAAANGVRTLTFTSGNWNTPQTITVTGVNDAIDNPGDERTGNLVTQIQGYGRNVRIPPISVTVTDDDTVPNAPTGLTVTPGDTTIKLDWANPRAGDIGSSPITDYEVSRDNGNNWSSTSSTDSSFNVTGLTNGTWYTFIVRAVSAAGKGAASSQVSAIPMAVAGITVSEVARTVAENGGTATYTIVLNTQPTGNVVITPSSSDATIATVSAALTFTTGNWNTAQTVTVTGVNDNIDNPVDRSATITHAVAGGGYGAIPATNVAVTVTDDDGVPNAPTNLTATAGNTTVKLDWDNPGAGDNGGSAISDYEVSSDDGTNWTSTSSTDSSVNVTGLTNGTEYTFRVRAVNAIGNSAASASVLATPDGTAPTVTITNQPANHDGTNAFDVSINFSEDVRSFVQGDVTLSNATVTSFTAHSASGYSVEITPTRGTTATITIDVGVNVAQDLATNPNTAAAQVSVTYVAPDVTAPTVTITNQPANHDGTNAFDVSINFSEDVRNFVQRDVTVGNATVTSFTEDSASSYSVEITPTRGTTATITIDVGANVAQDLANNNNTAAAQVSVAYVAPDVTPPTVVITTDAGASHDGNTAFIATFTFSEPLDPADAFAEGDITLTNADASNFAATTANRIYTATITPNADANITIDVAGGVAADPAGNDNTEAVQVSVPYVDTTPPTVVITTDAGASHDGNTPFTATFTFSELLDPADAFAEGDITLTNADASNFAATTANRIYTATITPNAAANITIDVNAGVAADPAGNDNTEAVQVSVAYVDTTDPTVVITTDAENGSHNGQAFTATFTFNEDVVNFVIGDIGVTGGAASNFVRTSARVYTATITPTDAYTNVAIDVNVGAAQDGAANDNEAAVQVIVRHAAPTAPRNFQARAGDTQVTLSWQAPVRAGSTAITGYQYRQQAGGGAWSNWQNIPTSAPGQANDDSFTVTGLTNNTAYTFEVRAENTGFDVGQSSNTSAPATPMAAVDNTPPTVTITNQPANHDGTNAFDVSINFSEPVQNFVQGDVTVGNAAVTSFTAHSASGYSVEITPTRGTTAAITIDVGANVAQDLANNNNTAAAQVSVAYVAPVAPDTDDPTVVITTDAEDGSHNGTAFTATFTFNEDVVGFVVGDIRVAGGAADNFVRTSARVYTARITPTDAYTNVAIDVNAGVAQDGAANDNEAAVQVIVPHAAPTAPRNFQAQAGDTQVTLSWQAPVRAGSTAITGYQYRQRAGGGAWGNWQNIPTSAPGQANDDSFTVTGLTNGTAYTFEVRAVNAAGKGAASASASETPVAPPATVPSAPTNLTATAGDTTVKLDWDVPADNGGSAITRYEVSRDNGNWSSTSSTDSSFNVTGLTNATRYTFRVRAVNVVGSSAASASVPATPMAADTTDPTVVITTDADAGSHNGTAFTATFTFNEDVVGFVVGDIRVAGGAASNFVRTSARVYTARITPTDAYTNVAIDVNAGVAQDGAANDNEAARQLIVPHAAPTAPRNFQAQAGDTQVTLSWQAPVRSGSTAISNYQYRQQAGAGAWGNWQNIPTSAPGQANDDSFTVTGLTNNTAYTFEVRAVNTSGLREGQSSASASATPMAVVVDNTAPTVTITPNNLDGDSHNGQAFDVDIEFSEAVVGFVQGDIQVGNGAVTGFNAGRAPIYVVEITPNAPDLDVTIDIDAGVAQDGATNQNLAAVQAVIPHGPPSAPRNLRAQAGDTQVTLSWQAPARAGAGTPITGYQYRQQAGAGAWSNWQNILNSAPGGANDDSFTVTGLTNNTRYTFEVRALNNEGSTTGVAASVSETPAAADVTAPTVTITNQPADHDGTNAFDVSINFSEDVRNFVQGDVTVGNATVTSFTEDSASSYSVEITPTRGTTATITIDVGANVAQDLANNDNTAAVQVSVLYVAPVVPGITVSEVARTVDENGGTATYTIVLDSQPTGNVTITPSSSDTNTATVSAALTFTTGNWNTAQTVTVTGVNDNIDNPVDRSATISHAVAGGGYGAVVAADVAVTVTDDDGVGITVSEANRTVAEAGGTATYTIVLNTQPTGNVVITPTSSDTNTATVSTALTFTTGNWNTAQTVTVTGVNDNIDNLNNRRSATITHAVAGGGYGAVVAANVAVTVTDDDGAGITVSQVARTVAEAGGTATYTIVLDSQPTGNVTITPSSSDATIATVSAALTFTTGNWNTAQTVTVTGVNDNIDNLNNRRSATITHAVAGGGYGAVVAANVAVTVTDDDGVGITVSEVARTVDEDGGTATYTLVLESPPTGNVTITPRSSDTDIATVSGALTFTAGNWDTAQTVTVTGVNDDIDNLNNRRSATITHPAAGGGYDAVVAPSVTVTVTDDDGAPQAEQRQQATQVTKTLTPEVSKVITSNLVSVLTDRLWDIATGARGFNLGNQSNVASLLKSHETAINNGEFELSQLLFNSGFSLSLEEESDSDLSIWGKGSYRDIAGGNTKRLKWDGRIESVSLGIDGYLDENTLMGVSVAASQARVEFTDYQSNAGKGDYDSDLSTISPYINWSWPKHSLWLMGSYGTGKIEQKLDQETVKRKADSRLISVATGGRMAIYQEQDNIAKGSSRVDIKAQASADRFKVKGSRDINEVDTNSRQLRMSVEGSHLYPSSAVSQLESKVELGVRYDGGEGETGWGSELGLGVGYSNRLSGFAIELNTRRLLTHTGDLEEWGVDGTITLKPGAQGYGPSFMWSVTRGGYEELGNRLLEADSLSSLSANAQGTNYRTEIGYGIALPLQTQTMLTPYTAIDLLSTGSKKYALGMRLNVEEDVQLSLEGSQHKAETADDDRQIELQLKLLDW